MAQGRGNNQIRGNSDFKATDTEPAIGIEQRSSDLSLYISNLKQLQKILHLQQQSLT